MVPPFVETTVERVSPFAGANAVAASALDVASGERLVLVDRPRLQTAEETSKERAAARVLDVLTATGGAGDPVNS
ncbi:MAG: hypothetical protein WKF75_07015 [Singulisphaera sp.]